MENKKILHKIVNLLDQNHIEYSLSKHAPVKTSEEAAKVRGVSIKSGAKAMIIKAKDSIIMVVLRGDKKIDFGKLKKLLGVKDVNLADKKEAEKTTKAKIGGIPPFGNLFNLETYFDKSLLENEFVNFSAGTRTHSINMKTKDLIRLVSPKVIEISKAK